MSQADQPYTGLVSLIKAFVLDFGGMWRAARQGWADRHKPDGIVGGEHLRFSEQAKMQAEATDRQMDSFIRKSRKDWDALLTPEERFFLRSRKGE